jgi:uncharacterized lipoprotein YddW (UPF0748 family)
LSRNRVTLLDEPEVPRVYTRTVEIRNLGGYTLAWQTGIMSGGLALAVTPAVGLQDGWITLTLDGRQHATATAFYTGRISVGVDPGMTSQHPVLDTPQEIVVRLRTAREKVYLPYLVKNLAPPPPPPVPREVRAVWITRYDWTSAYAPETPADVDRMVSNVAQAGFNTIFFQVRAHGDAYYQPGLEPWSARLNDAGVLGQDPGWDPLARMLEQAHAHGLQVQAYVNVYPAWLGTAPPPETATPRHIFWTWSYDYGVFDWRQWHRTGGPMLLNSSYVWSSPGLDGVRDHVVAVVGDIVARYQVDGVHLDLVRYANSPYSYDPVSNAAAGSSDTPARAQWQRDRVSDLVGRVHAALGEVRPEARLSAAVWFCYDAGGCGYGLSSGFAHYYQDSLGWLATGRIDAIAPMLYGWSGFQDLDIWRTVMQQFQDGSAGGDVYPGISGDFDNFAEIAARIEAAREAGTAGHAIFSYGALNLHGYWDDLASGPYAD